MSLPAGWQCTIEIHPPNWEFPAGASWIAGWISAGTNLPITDLRAWIDRRPFLGLLGLPRPGIDERLLGRPGPPFAGFSFLINPHRHAATIRIEARDLAGKWHEIFTRPITADPTAARQVVPVALAAQLDTALPALLKSHARDPQVPLGILAQEVLALAVSEPLNSLPNPPFFGALEEPQATGRLRYGRLTVTGWLAHRACRIARLTAMVDPGQELDLLHGLPREGVGEVFNDLPGHENSQFVGHVDLPASFSVPALLLIFAELTNGEKHLVFAQRFKPVIIAGADESLPPVSGLIFFRSLWALLGAARSLGIPTGSPAALLRAASVARGAIAAFAPPLGPSRSKPRAIPISAEGDGQPIRVLIVTHNLNFEGAPWFILELARFLATQPRVTVQVVSPADGPLRREFERAGMPVGILTLESVLGATTPREFDAELAKVGAQINWSSVDVVVANTMVSFWAVHLATRAGKPAVLYVHESTAVRRYFEPLLAPALFPRVEQAFRDAGRVIFTAESTRRVHDHLDRGSFTSLPSWVDVDRIDEFAATHDKLRLRRKHGLDPDALLLVNIGSLCERKGQHVFLKAIDLLQAELPAAFPGRKIQFAMVGARPGPYCEALKMEARLHRLDEVVFIPETGEIHDFYHMADVFVCTSFEESFPRVLLESAAFRLPIVSTNVNGIAEMLTPEEAWLTAPGDRHQLARAMKQAMTACEAGDTARVERARATITSRYHGAKSLPQHLAVIRSALVPPSG